MGKLRELYAHMPGVRLAGHVSRAEVLRLQRTSELHLHPCIRTENFCYASLECQAAGTPTVTTDRGAMPTTVLSGRTGICVAADPLETFGQRYGAEVVNLMEDPETIRRLASAARRRALSEFSPAAIVERWMSHWAHDGT
jgi:glycosyltransferase involved in cell wall biosynthesis